MSTPEYKVKAIVTDILDEHDIYYFKPATYGYGRSGVPDVVACYKGTFIAIECKAGKNKPTKLQEREIARIKEAGGIALVINGDNTTSHQFLTKKGK
jgi:Holliday junction resolvase